MNFKKWLFEMRNVKYEFSSTQVDVPKKLADRIIKWGKKHIHDSSLFTNDDDSLGREDEIHATVLYGIHSEFPSKTKRTLKNEKAIKVKLGKMKAFTNHDKFDVIIVDVKSDDLNKINEILRDKIPFTNKYDEYRPHVTIAYVEKGQGEKLIGDDSFEGEEFICDYIVFSSKGGQKTRIQLS